MNNVMARAAVLGMLLFSTVEANATLVDFNSSGSKCIAGAGWDIGGLNFSVSYSNLCTWGGGSNVANNGTIGLLVYGNSLTVSATSGSSFNLDSFDAGISWYDSALTRDLLATASLTGGGTEEFNFTIDRTFQSFVPALAGVDSITFGLLPGSSYIAFDNFSYTEVATSVAEPANILLFALGFIGISIHRRKLDKLVRKVTAC